MSVSARMEESPTALGGLRVVDLSWGLAGCLSSLFLADHGAEVVRIEPPGGDLLRRERAWPLWGRGKQSVLCDLQTSAGRERTTRLLRDTDIAITTYRPGTAARLGLDYESLAPENPRLIYTSITGFGPRGPLSQLPGYDGIVLAKLGGMAHVAGMAPRPGPAFPATPYASFSAAQTALHGIFAGLLERSRSGRGQLVETSLAQGLAAHDPWDWFLRILCEKYPQAYNSAPPYSERGVPNSGFAFRLLVGLTKDGHWLQFSQTSPHLFRDFIDVLGLGWIWNDPELHSAPDFESEALRERFWEMLLAATRQRTLSEWQEVFRSHPNVWAELFRTTREALDHPQMQHNRHVIALADPQVGPTRQLGPLVTCERTPARVNQPAPRLGEHTARTSHAHPSPVAAASLPARADVDQASRESRPPLCGVTILEFGLFYAAPYGPALLADLGARVIKIEPLTGEPTRHIMPVPDAGAVKSLQGKESLALDLEKPESHEIIARLARRADAALVAYRGGVAERHGVDYESLARVNPRLVFLYAPGYGIDGPCARKPAYAPTIGVGIGVGRFQAGPSIPFAPDLTLEQLKQPSIRLSYSAQAPGNADGCSALGVASALLLGLVARERTGLGQRLLTSMLCTTAYAVSDDAIDYPGIAPRREPDPMLYGLSALYRLYEASSGWVFLACVKDREWQRLCAADNSFTALATDSRFSTPTRREVHDAALAEALSTIFLDRAAGEWEQLLIGHDVPCVEVMSGPVAARVIDEATMRPAGFLADVEHPTFGPHRRLAPLVSLSRTPGRVAPACTLGQHSRSILAEIGYADAEIADLADRQVVALG